MSQSETYSAEATPSPLKCTIRLHYLCRLQYCRHNPSHKPHRPIEGIRLPRAGII